MLKKWMNLTLTSLATAGVLLAGGISPAAANHHMNHRQGLHGCSNVMVSGKMAYLKMNPMMGAKTLRMAHHGEKFTVVTDGKGHAHHWDGWWLVRSSNGYRYWAHQSMLSCSSKSSSSASHDHASHHGGTTPKDHDHSSHHSSSTSHHHSGHHHNHHGKNPHKMGCANVNATGAAYLKFYPMMGSKTIGMARKGDSFMTVKNPNGHPVHANGWFLVKKSNGYRYYIHNSMIKCQE